MVPHLSSAYAKTPRSNPDLPAWALEAAASAPRISPADAAPLIAIFRSAILPAAPVADAA